VGRKEEVITVKHVKALWRRLIELHKITLDLALPPHIPRCQESGGRKAPPSRGRGWGAAKTSGFPL
jgi:hypothetical protein